MIPADTGTNRRFVQAGYLVAVLFGLTPLVDTLLPFLPPRVADAHWRFVMAGTLSNAVLLPLLALGVALMCARLARSRGAQRVVTWLTAAYTALLALLIVSFVVDYYQLRSTVPVQYQQASVRATAHAFVNYLFVLVGAAALLAALISDRDRTRANASIPTTPNATL